MPEEGVPGTEKPGSNPTDRPAMRKMVEQGFLDMEELAKMERSDLVSALSILTDDYQAWIEEQTARVGADVLGHDKEAEEALKKCQAIQDRLEEGIKLLSETDDALRAFRTANLAMADQRIRSR